MDMNRGGIAYISRRMMRLELPDRKPRGRPKRWFMNVEKEDMKLAGVKEEDGVRWRWMIHRKEKI